MIHGPARTATGACQVDKTRRAPVDFGRVRLVRHKAGGYDPMFITLWTMFITMNAQP